MESRKKSIHKKKGAQKMKTSYKLISFLLALLLLLPAIAACDSASSNEETTLAQNESVAENTAAQAKDERAKKARNENQGEEISVLFFNLFFRQLNKFRLYRHKSSFIIYYA